MLARDLSESAISRAIRHELTVQSSTVVYFEYPALARDAQTLVMIHGYRGNHHGLELIAAGLSKYRVIIPDLPGFGQSAPLSLTHTIESYSNWLYQFVTNLGIVDRVHLIGHSFGTLIVGHYATKHNPSSISLINPVSAPALKGPKASLTALTRIFYSIAKSLPTGLGQWLLRNKVAVMVMSVVMTKTKSRQLRKWIHNQHLRNFSDFATVAVACEGYTASISSDLSQFAAQISAPTLVIAATLDDITSIQIQRNVVKLYQNAQYKEIVGVGHLVHYEAPDQAAAMVSEFLEEQT